MPKIVLDAELQLVAQRKYFHQDHSPTSAGPVSGGGGLPDGYQATGWGFMWTPANGTDRIYFSRVSNGVSGLSFDAEVEGPGELTFTQIGLSGLSYQGQGSL